MGRRKHGLLVDDVDAHILEFLQRDARTPITEIARKAGLSDVAIRRRIERLVRDEVVTFRAHVDPLKIGFSVWAMMWIQAEPRSIDSVAEQVARLPGVFLVCLGTGEFDIYAVAVFRSGEEFTQFVNEKLMKIRGVTRTTTSYITRVVKRDFAFGVPLASEQAGRAGERNGGQDGAPGQRRNSRRSRAHGK